MPGLRRYGVGGEGELTEERSVECPVCRGEFKRCRLMTCPYLREVREVLRRVEGSRTVFGSSPPSALVGSWGYPKLLAGPLVPPLQADTSLMERYDLWLEMPLAKLLAMRLSLVRGKSLMKVEDARGPSRLLQHLQELAMAYAPTDVEMRLNKEPRIRPGFLVRSAPTGPSAPLERVEIAQNPAVPRAVENVVSDTDLKAGEAVLTLYRSGIPETHITRLLSLGLLGTARGRRLVPTEWSITAVDDLIGKKLRRRVREYDWINRYYVYGHEAHFNRVTVILIPGPWMFEVLEVWHRGGVVRLYEDSELPGDVERYPENVGGGYHALRLPVLEKLENMRRQAAALVLAEVREGWIPLGVWRFREICRRALEKKPQVFDDLDEALKAAGKMTVSPLQFWEARSRLIRFHRTQQRLTTFFTSRK